MGFTWDLPYDSIDISTMWGFSGISWDLPYRID